MVIDLRVVRKENGENMKYIMFKADPIYDSIILAVPDSVKGEKPESNDGVWGIECGFGNFEIHISFSTKNN